MLTIFLQIVAMAFTYLICATFVYLFVMLKVSLWSAGLASPVSSCNC